MGQVVFGEFVRFIEKNSAPFRTDLCFRCEYLNSVLFQICITSASSRGFFFFFVVEVLLWFLTRLRNSNFSFSIFSRRLVTVLARRVYLVGIYLTNRRLLCNVPGKSHPKKRRSLRVMISIDNEAQTRALAGKTRASRQKFKRYHWTLPVEII